MFFKGSWADSFRRFVRNRPRLRWQLCLMTHESLTQDFRVADDRADLSEGLLAGLLHLHMGVGQHLSQFWHDAGQAGRQLLGCTESHGTQQLH